jgi:hypothetical protein
MPGSDHVKLKFTYDDFLQFPDDGKRHELVKGPLLHALTRHQAPADIREPDTDDSSMAPRASAR